MGFSRKILAAACVAGFALLGSVLPLERFVAVFAAEACGCAVSVFIGKVSPVTRSNVGQAKVAGAGDEKLKAEIAAGVKEAGFDPPAGEDKTKLDKAIGEAVDEIIKKDHAGYTFNHLDFNWSYTLKPDGTVDATTVTWDDYVVVLLPTAAINPDQVKNHEEGHVILRQLLKDYAKTRYEALFPALVGQPEATADAMITDLFNELQKLGKAAEGKYDHSTQHGKKGGLNQQDLAKAAFADSVKPPKK